jgi:hypothetical protein
MQAHRTCTRNVTSDSVGLLTYCSPRNTLRPGCSSSGRSPVALAFFASSNSAPESRDSGSGGSRSSSRSSSSVVPRACICYLCNGPPQHKEALL